MKRIRFTMLGAGMILLSLVSCQSPSGPSFPPAPPPPAGAITCVGRAEINREAGTSTLADVWYAYWLEPHDSVSGILQIGVIDSRLEDTIRDTMYLDRSGQALTFAPNDPRAPYYTNNDSTSIARMFGKETSDSLIVGWSGFPGSSTSYFLKKLN
jgi:hypothetical protein